MGGEGGGGGHRKLRINIVQIWENLNLHYCYILGTCVAQILRNMFHGFCIALNKFVKQSMIHF